MKKILSLILSVIMCFSVFSLVVSAEETEEYIKISSGETKNVTLSNIEDMQILKFVPGEDGIYKFYSMGNCDTVVTLYDDNFDMLDSVDDYEGLNFCLFYELKANETYYYEVHVINSEENNLSFDVRLEKCIEPEAISLSTTDDIELAIREKVEIEVDITPADALSKFNVNIDNGNLAVYFNDKGFELEATQPGTAKVTVSTLNGISQSFNVTVIKPDAKVISEATPYTLTEADEGYCVFSFTPNVEEVDAYNLATKNNENIRVKISDNSGLEMWDEGINLNNPVKCWAGKTYEIVVVDGKAGDQIAISKHSVKLESVEIVEKDYFGNKEQQVQLEYNFIPFYASRGPVYWSSSDTGIASVNDYGIVHFNSNEGTAEITLTCNGISDTITVTAKEHDEIEVGFNKNYKLPESATLVYKFIPEKSGKYELYTTGDCDTCAELYDEDSNCLMVNDDYEDLNCKLSYLYEAGKTYYLHVYEIERAEAEFGVFFEEGLSVTSIEILKMPDEQKIYPESIQSVSLWGLEMRFNFSDGSSEDVRYIEDDAYIQYEVNLTDVGETELIYTIEADGVTKAFTLPISYNPIERIDVDDSFKITLYEHVGGVWNEYENYYWYNFSIPDDVKVTAYYKDGTIKTINVYDALEGNYMSTINYQQENPWVIGGEQYIEIMFLGLKDKVPVEIIKNPVVSAEITKLPDKTQYIFGDVHHGYMDEEGNYWFRPLFDGMEITVINEDESQNVYSFDEDPRLFYDMCNLAGFEISAQKTGDAQVVFDFFAVPISFKVDIIPTKITDIEILKYPENAVYHYSALPNINGMEIKISYADNTSKIVTVTEDVIRTIENSYYMHMMIECGEEDLIYFQRYDEVCIEGGGLSVTVDLSKFNVIEEEVTELEILKFDTEEFVVTMHITYANGDERDLKMNILDKEFIGYCDLGLLECYFDVDEKDGNFKGMLYVFGDEYDVDFSVGGMLGDCNDDGAVDTVDLANLKLYLAGLDEIGNNADMNGDGNVDTVDLAQLKLTLAGL